MKLVTEDGKLTANGELLYERCIQENPDPEKFIPVLIGADWWRLPNSDEVALLKAYLRRLPDGTVYLWNGWAEPAFTRETVDQVIVLNNLHRREVGNDLASIEWDGDVVVVTDYAYVDEHEPDPQVARIERRDGLYDFVLSWCFWIAGDTLRRSDGFHDWLVSLNAVVSERPLKIAHVMGVRDESGAPVHDLDLFVHRVDPRGTWAVKSLYEEGRSPLEARDRLRPHLEVRWAVSVVPEKP